MSSRRSRSEESSITAISATPTMAMRVNMVPTVSEASFCFFAPTYCPTITVPEMVRPLTIMATRWVIWLPMFTPERICALTTGSGSA